MKYVHYIDRLVNVQRQQHGDENAPWFIARQHPGYGLLYWEIRVRMAWACLTGKADAVRFHEDD
jgi:hypothetical protein